MKKEKVEIFMSNERRNIITTINFRKTMSHQIENIQIVLQKPDNQAVYLPGDPLIGIFSFRLVERLSVVSVRIVVDGSTRVKW